MGKENISLRRLTTNHWAQRAAEGLRWARRSRDCGNLDICCSGFSEGTDGVPVPVPLFLKANQCPKDPNPRAGGADVNAKEELRRLEILGNQERSQQKRQVRSRVTHLPCQVPFSGPGILKASARSSSPIIVEYLKWQLNLAD